MTTASLLKANQLIVSKRRQNFDGDLNFTNPVKLFARPISISVNKVHNFIHLTSDITTTTRNNAAAVHVPFNSKVQFGSFSSKVSPLEKPVTNGVLEFLNLLKVPAVAVVRSLLLLLMMVMINCRASALACTPPSSSTGRHDSLSGQNQALHEENVKMSMADDAELLLRMLQRLAADYGQNKVAVKKDVYRISGTYMESFLGLLFFVIGPSIYYLVQKYRESRLNVIKLQVGLRHSSTAYLWFLDRIAETADTSTEDGKRDLLETLSEQFSTGRDFWVAVSSSVKVCKSIEDAEKSFNQLLVEGRGNFDEEFVLMKEKRRITHSRDFDYSYFTVITFVVVAKGKGVPGFPKIIWKKEQLEEAFRQLQTISTSAKIEALGILSSHRNSDKFETFKVLRRILKEKYPHLRTFSID